MATLLEKSVRISRAALIRALGVKAAELPFSAPWSIGSSWPSLDWNRLVAEGYNVNAAVGACARALAFAFPEPPPVVKNRAGEKQARHPLQALLDRPNALMSHDELLVYVIVYMAIGGNCYLHKVRSAGRRVVELWPYHAGHITPISRGAEWVAAYRYDDGAGDKRELAPEDIVHLKWPMPDLKQPWLALPPLRQVAREVDSDSEMTRMLYAFLRNDATPRTILNIKASLTQQQADRLVAQWRERHGGDNRGSVSVVEGDATVSRIGLDLQQLDLSALRGVPEARICAAFGVPPEVAALSVGMAHSTENNLQSADIRFTTRTLVPLWKIVAGELTQDLVPEFGGNVTVEYDTGQVQALQENQDSLYTRVLNAYDKIVITKNEARGMLGLPPVAQLRRDDPEGDVFKGERVPGELVPPAMPNLLPQPEQQPAETGS